MKKIKTFLLFILLAYVTDAQSKKYAYDSISLPSSETVFTSFYVNEINQVFLSVNGGVYLPKDSLWFLPPAKGHYFTSMAPNVKDTGLFVMSNSIDSSEMYYLKTSANGSVKKYLVAKLHKGIYNLIYKNGLCCIWGYDSKDSKIGVLSNNGIKWLISIKGIISQVQINDSSEIFFAFKNAIYQLDAKKIIVKLDTNVIGFDFDGKGNLIISCKEGVGFADNGRLTMIAIGINGLVQYKNENLFVLPRKGNYLYDIYQL